MPASTGDITMSWCCRLLQAVKRLAHAAGDHAARRIEPGLLEPGPLHEVLVHCEGSSRNHDANSVDGTLGDALGL